MSAGPSDLNFHQLDDNFHYFFYKFHFNAYVARSEMIQYSSVNTLFFKDWKFSSILLKYLHYSIFHVQYRYYQDTA